VENVDLFRGYGVEIRLPDPESFLKVRETLTRIGVASKKEKVLYQSCHILHKQGRYVILHFKELFGLDGKPNNFSDEDRARRNTIANLLWEWDLVEIINPETSKDPVLPVSQLKIIPHKEKGEWKLVQKYTIGRKSDNKPKPQLLLEQKKDLTL
jgi:hypothetical protein